MKAKSVVQQLKFKFIEKYGKPKTILSDHGGCFISREWKECLHDLNIERRLTLLCIIHNQILASV